MKDARVAPTIVYCGKCGMGNPAANRFCYDCGSSLFSIACPFCSQENPHYAKFCGSCGRKLAAQERSGR